MSLYEGAVKKPIMTSLCFLAVAIFGLFSLSKLPVDLYPDIDTNTIMVMTSYQGASASDIENNVTRPLENTLNSVSNLKHITSKSSENISVITLEFEYGYDIDVLTNDGAENKNTPGGTFDVGSNTYSLRVEGEFKDPKEMENIVVGIRNGASVYLRDVATVVDSVEERAQETYNNGVQGAMIVVQKQSGANSVNISRKVMEQLPKLQKSLPSDVKLGVIVNTSDNILNTIDSLTETIMYAILFVVLVVFVFLGRWRATVIICITIPMSLSTISALSFTPMMCAQMLRLQKKQSKWFVTFYKPIERALDGLDNWYQKRLNWAVRHRKTIIAGCFGFFLLSLICAKGIGTEFFPSQDNSRISVQLQLPIGARVERAQALAQELTERWLKKYEGVMRICNYTVGQADADNTWASIQDNGSHIISFNINLYNPDQRSVTLAEVCDGMREDLKAYPELDKAQVILGGSSGGMGGQATADFEIYGYDFTETDKAAAELKEALLKVNGVSEVNISRQDYQPEYQVDFDREKLALHGLNLSTAALYLRNRVNGALSSYYREDGDEYDIKVRYAPQFRTSIESLENILIYTNEGKAIRVKDIGTVVERSAPPTIERKDRERIVTVSAVISGAPLGSVVAAGESIIDKMDLPGGISIQVAGSYEDQQDSFSDLGTLAVLIIILVFIVMAAQFESLTYPFIIMFSIPFAFSGVLMALYGTGTTLNVMSLLGGIMLIGIVVKNGIVLIDYITLCRERGMSVIHSVVVSGRSRLRPVLMTTLTTILGMVPMAIGGGEGSEMWQPLGVSVIGGLTVSTVLTLILVPVLYCSFAGTGIKRNRKKMKASRELNDYYQAHKTEMTKGKKE